MADEDQGNQGESQGQGDEGQGTEIQGQDWRAGLPDDLRTEKSLEAIKDVGGLAKSYVESQKMIGGSVRLPKEGATPEEIDAFHTKLGRPEKPEGYGFVKPATLPEGVTWNDDLVGWFGKSAHAVGLSKAQANSLLNAWNDNQFSQAHEGQKVMKAELGKLQEEWGDRFDGRVELGLRGIERILPAEEATQFKSLMDSTGLGNHPLMLRFAYQVGNLLKEDGYIMSDGKGGIMGADSAKTKIEAVNADPKHAYWDETNPGHKAAVAEMSQLFKLAGQK